MEKPPIEKIIEKLEKTDIQRWKLVYEPAFSKNFLFVETNGLRFSIEKYDKSYSMYIENVEDRMTNNWGIITYTFDKKNKAQKAIFEKFYEQILESLREDKEKRALEKLDEFVSE